MLQRVWQLEVLQKFLLLSGLVLDVDAHLVEMCSNRLISRIQILARELFFLVCIVLLLQCGLPLFRFLLLV